MPFGYLEFLRAKRRELCSHMRACAPPLAAAARARAGAGSGSGLGLGSGSGSLPGLVLFESGFRVWAEQIHSTTQSAPARQRVSARTDPNRSPTAVGKPTVRLNGCDGSVRTVATVDFWRTRIPFRSAINSAPEVHSQTHQQSLNILSLYTEF